MQVIEKLKYNNYFTETTYYTQFQYADSETKTFIQKNEISFFRFEDELELIRKQPRGILIWNDQ